jgi:hypothetical protein
MASIGAFNVLNNGFQNIGSMLAIEVLIFDGQEFATGIVPVLIIQTVKPV